MIKIFNTRLLALLCLILSVAVFTACDKDDDEVNSGEVQLLSFGPTGARPGDTLRFIGVNLNKITAIHFAGENATVEQKDFKQQTSDLILVIVPQGTEKGYVTLKTPEGDITTKTQLNLKVAAQVTGIVPPQARPGQNITISGNYLNWVSKVTFEDDKEVTTFVSKSMNQLVVRVPDDAKTGPIRLTYQGTDSGVVQTADTLRVALPVATSFSPNPVKHGGNLTITGTDLDLTKQIVFPGVTAAVSNFVSQSATQIVVKVPDNARTGKIMLVPLSGVQSSSTIDLQIPELLPPPTIKLPFFLDAVSTNWNGWIGGGWGGTSDRNNAAPVREGSRSVRINYVGGYGSPLQLGGATVNLAQYTKLKFSVFGAPGSGGKKATIGINGVNGKFVFDIVEGKWTDYEVPLSTLTSETVLKEFWVQEYSGTGGFSIYVDAIGLD